MVPSQRCDSQVMWYLSGMLIYNRSHPKYLSDMEDLLVIHFIEGYQSSIHLGVKYTKYTQRKVLVKFLHNIAATKKAVILMMVPMLTKNTKGKQNDTKNRGSCPVEALLPNIAKKNYHALIKLYNFQAEITENCVYL